MMWLTRIFAVVVLWLGIQSDTVAEDRLQQQAFADSALSLAEIRRAGLEVFAAPFTFEDGFGDGPMDPLDPLTPGKRPTLNGNGTFLRVNGLDGQACVDCHGRVSSTTVPPLFGVGGFGTAAQGPIVRPRAIDVEDSEQLGMAFMDGRFIVAPHLFGSGGVQLLAEEMTAELHALRTRALANPGSFVQLLSKGVDFGVIAANAEGELDTSGVEGVDADLVVRPFGRKGSFATVRDFALDAMPFHFGIEPTEKVGVGSDGDGDGVVDEITAGEISALEIFLLSMDTPVSSASRQARIGGKIFRAIGCADCHRPAMRSEASTLALAIEDHPAHFQLDLALLFDTSPAGGLQVALYSDLKRHFLGEELIESAHQQTARQNAEFLTAKLWGVGDSPPYLHDGRALTLREAILWHGGDADHARTAFERLSFEAQERLLDFLRSLRLPREPNKDVVDEE